MSNPAFTSLSKIIVVLSSSLHTPFDTVSFTVLVLDAGNEIACAGVVTFTLSLKTHCQLLTLFAPLCEKVRLSKRQPRTVLYVNAAETVSAVVKFTGCG